MFGLLGHALDGGWAVNGLGDADAVPHHQNVRINREPEDFDSPFGVETCAFFAQSHILCRCPRFALTAEAADGRKGRRSAARTVSPMRWDDLLRRGVVLAEEIDMQPNVVPISVPQTAISLTSKSHVSPRISGTLIFPKELITATRGRDPKDTEL